MTADEKDTSVDGEASKDKDDGITKRILEEKTESSAKDPQESTTTKSPETVTPSPQPGPSKSPEEWLSEKLKRPSLRKHFPKPTPLDRKILLSLKKNGFRLLCQNQAPLGGLSASEFLLREAFALSTLILLLLIVVSCALCIHLCRLLRAKERTGLTKIYNWQSGDVGEDEDRNLEQESARFLKHERKRLKKLMLKKEAAAEKAPKIAVNSGREQAPKKRIAVNTESGREELVDDGFRGEEWYSTSLVNVEKEGVEMTRVRGVRDSTGGEKLNPNFLNDDIDYIEESPTVIAEASPGILSSRSAKSSTIIGTEISAVPHLGVSEDSDVDFNLVTTFAAPIVDDGGFDVDGEDST